MSGKLLVSVKNSCLLKVTIGCIISFYMYKKGFVTTTRVTHATPAGLYAHSSSRDWECDSQVPQANRKECKDIARQLIEDDPGKNARVKQVLLSRYFLKQR